MQKLLFLAAAAALAGCGSTGPVQTAPNTYMIAKTSGGGLFVSGAEVKADLIKEGTEHCAKGGKRFELISGEGKNAIPFARTSQAEISYKCI